MSVSQRERENHTTSPWSGFDPSTLVKNPYESSSLPLDHSARLRTLNLIKGGLPFPGHLSRLDSFNPLLLLDVVVKPVGPLADTSDVEREVIAVLGSRAGSANRRSLVLELSRSA